MRNAYKILEKTTRKTCAKDNIEINFGEIRFGGVDWIYVAQDRDLRRFGVNTVTNLLIP
jgi:hypothetical protein